MRDDDGPEDDGLDDELGEIETEPATDAEFCDADDACYYAPEGWGEVGLRFDAPLIRVLTRKAGAVEVLHSKDGGKTWKWVDVTKLAPAATVSAIRSPEAPK